MHRIGPAQNLLGERIGGSGGWGFGGGANYAALVAEKLEGKAREDASGSFDCSLSR